MAEHAGQCTRGNDDCTIIKSRLRRFIEAKFQVVARDREGLPRCDANPSIAAARRTAAITMQVRYAPRSD